MEMFHLFIFLLFTLILILLPANIHSKKTKSIFPTNSKNKKNRNHLQNFVSNFKYLMLVFDFLHQNNFGVHFIWTLGFIAWIIGCCFWVIKIDLFSLIFVSVSIIFSLVSIISTSDVKLNHQENLIKTLDR